MGASSISISRGRLTVISLCLRFTELSSTVILNPSWDNRRDHIRSLISSPPVWKQAEVMANRFAGYGLRSRLHKHDKFTL